MVGDCRTAALIGADGGVDWLCLPQFDSGSVFQRLLDRWRGGFFAVSPCEEGAVARRRYVGRTAVLETIFETKSGKARALDFMPALSERDKRRRLLPYWSLIRIVEGLEGEVPFDVLLRPRPEDAARLAAVAQRGLGVACDVHGGLLRLDASERLCACEGGARGRFVARPGKRDVAWLTWSPGPAVVPGLGEAAELLELTKAYWEAWSRVCDCKVPGEEAVRRSALTLKLLSFAPSGAVVAAPTTSLPEYVGGRRNWDYRYCWLRDAAYTASSFYRLGHVKEAEAFVQWMLYATTLTQPKLRVFYDVFGLFRGREGEMPLDGYRGSRPVRRGNDALEQFQLDVYGEVLESVTLYLDHGGKPDAQLKKFVRGVADFICASWDIPDQGIWEPRSPPRHYVHSKVMCWDALKRAADMADRIGARSERDRWRCCADAIRDAVLKHGFSRERNSFVKSFGSEKLDAALLLIPGTDFLPGDDPRVLGTIEAVQRDLGVGRGLVRRYLWHDGMSGPDNAFLCCSYWLVEALALAGRLDEARGLFEEAGRRASPLGLFSEEADILTGELLGNFPQALTHLAHVDAAYALAGRLT